LTREKRGEKRERERVRKRESAEYTRRVQEQKERREEGSTGRI